MRIEFQVPRSFELIPRLWVGGSPILTSRDDAPEIDLIAFCAPEYTPVMAKLDHAVHAVVTLKPIPDDNAVPLTFEQKLELGTFARVLQVQHMKGRTVAATCLGGKNRSCTLAALILLGLGWTPQQAIDAIRLRRPGALTNHHLCDLILAGGNPGKPPSNLAW